MRSFNYNIFPSLYWRLFLKPLGLNTENSLVLWLLMIYGSIIIGGLWLFQGDVPVVLSIVYLVTIFFLSFLRLDYSLYLLLFGVLIFDQFGIPTYNPFTYQIDFFRNLKEISYIPFFNSGMANPIEIHLFFIIFSLILIFAIKKDFTWRPIAVPIPFFIFFGFFVMSFLYGMKNGGDFMVALWEIRAFFYFFILYLITPQIIRNKEQIRVLVWIFIISITFKALQGIERFIELGFTTGGKATLTNHEDPVFIVTLLILLLGLLVFRSKDKQRMWLLILLIPLLLGFYVGLRRAAYASFMVSFATFVVLLPTQIRWKFIKGMFPVFIVIAIYAGAFWNNNGTLGRPVQMIKSGFETPTKEKNVDDYYSNLYRDFEDYNLAQTVVYNPIKGIGFGKKYAQPIPLVNIRFPLRDYIPHNEIMWILVKMGAIGFLVFWFFFNSFAAKGVKIFARLEDPYLKAIALFIVIAIINQMVISYFDLQLTYYRNMIYLGCLMGLLPTVGQYVTENKEGKEEDSDSEENEQKSSEQ